MDTILSLLESHNRNFIDYLLPACASIYQYIFVYLSRTLRALRALFAQPNIPYETPKSHAALRINSFTKLQPAGFILFLQFFSSLYSSSLRRCVQEIAQTIRDSSRSSPCGSAVHGHALRAENNSHCTTRHARWAFGTFTSKKSIIV